MNRRIFSLLIVAVGLMAAQTSTSAPASSDPLHPSAAYDQRIPAPESVLGYRIGEQFTPYDQLEKYLTTLAAAAPDRARLTSFGKSVEGRKQYTLVITSPENMQRLEQIRAAVLSLTDPRKTSEAQAQQVAAKTPVEVWMSYNIHGNESNSTEAAMQVAYELLASEDARVKQWLSQAVIILDPVENPDGRERYVQFYRTHEGTEARSDRFAAEHDEAWPGGRFNHYLFDLNRDWSWQSQPESRNRVAEYRRWQPQVHVDLHEMGSSDSYYFAPPAGPIYAPLIPTLTKWFKVYGEANAAAFDRWGFRYFTREGYDLFYPSYGDSWPSLNGAVGMTYEQAGGGNAGLAIELADHQRLLTLRDRVSRHFTASLATIDATVAHRQDRLLDFYRFHRAAIDDAGKEAVKQYVILPGSDPQRFRHAEQIFEQQGIEVSELQSDTDADGLIPYYGDATTAVHKRLPAGTLLIDAAQPMGFLVRSMMEPQPKPSLNYFYDVSGWALPYAMDLEAYQVTRAIRLPEEKIRGGFFSHPVSFEHAAAYVIPWEQSAAVPVVAKLLNEGIRANVAIKPFTLKGQKFSAGTVVVPMESNPADLGQRMQKLAQEEGARIVAMPTLLVESGTDLGSRNQRFLRKPRVAVVTDQPTSPTEYGAIWDYFENHAKIPFTPIRAEGLRGADLSNYNVLILPPDRGDGAGYARVFDKGVTAKLQEWVQNGGVLIAIKGGAVWATKKQSGLTSVTYRLVQREAEEARQEAEKAASTGPGAASSGAAGAKPAASEEAKKLDEEAIKRRTMKYGEREAEYRNEIIPGTILLTQLDGTHPLGFGIGTDTLPVLDDTAPVLELTDKGENPVYFGRGGLKLSGQISPETEKKLNYTAWCEREPVGKGQVILFADTPLFRGHWDATVRVLTNAVLFGQVVDPNVR
ncbi:MAG: hypothetical protein JOZ43_03915 [Acidobacteriales bacterium]|nr:hypothetical protein [Terriglobales bacterium]